MKIPFTNIELFSKATEPLAAIEQKKKAKLFEQIQRTQLLRQQETVRKWRDAISNAESILLPERRPLIRIYRDIILDAHVMNVCRSFSLNITSGEFYLVDKAGNVNEEATSLFYNKWFSDFLKYTSEANLWGYSLIQLGPVNEKGYEYVKLIPREYVIIDKKQVKVHLYNRGEVIDYSSDVFKPWIVEVYEQGNLGLLSNVAPLAIWKKNAIIAWSQYAELYGQPIRVGKTNIEDPNLKTNMKTMLETMGSSLWAIMDIDDSLEFIEANDDDAYSVFMELINVCNKEISKVVLGQTMTTDDGSSRSQSEVHERQMDKLINAEKKYIEYCVNDKLLPSMEMNGLIPSGLSFIWDQSENLSMMDQLKIVDTLLKNYDIEPEEIKERFGIEVFKKGEISTSNDAAKVIEDMYNYYKDYTPEHKH
jgi:hypothetical protein